MGLEEIKGVEENTKKKNVRPWDEMETSKWAASVGEAKQMEEKREKDTGASGQWEQKSKGERKG